MNMHGVVRELTESHRSGEQPMALQKEGEQAAGLTRPKPWTLSHLKILNREMPIWTHVSANILYDLLSVPPHNLSNSTDIANEDE